MFRKILLAVLIFSFIVFCALFGSLPRLRKTPIGFINRLIWIKIPGTFYQIDRILTGGRFALTLRRASHYLMHENHPLVLIFYLSVVFAFQCVFLPVAWHRLYLYEQGVTLAAIAGPYAFTYLAVTSTAHVITKESHARHMRQYPYDHVLFHPNQPCQTCLWLKPARSKHCSVCNRCVAKQDHHCVWVMNCLGRGNYHYFLGMVLSLGIMLCYGAYLSHSLLDQVLQRDFVQGLGGRNAVHWTHGKSYSQRFDYWANAFIDDIRVAATGLLCLFTAPLAWVMLLYHVYLIWAGTTTNESFKWEEWKEDISDGYVYSCNGPEAPARDGNNDSSHQGIPWPVSNSQRLVSQANKASMQAEQEPNLKEPPWEQVRSMKEIVNIYDLGFWNNLKDVFHMK